MNEIIEAIKKASIKIKDAIITDSTEYSTHHNATGDTQLKLDIKSDIIIEEEFSKVNSIKEIASEEKETTKKLHTDGRFVVAYDPLDGSSLIDVNLSVGSIFGIYEKSFEAQNLVTSVYVVYGPRVELVVTTDKVELFRLDLKNNYNFIKEIKLNKKGKINASGATQKGWSSYHKKLIDDIFADGYRLRYSGGMVPDLHQILLKGGGLFSYPSTTDTPKGKLRKLFEVFPFALTFEVAGGKAIDGYRRVLDLDVQHPHDTTPCFFGSNDECDRVLKVYEQNR